jgi:hypothetical protein
VPRGGRRVGAGRKKGTPNKRRRGVAEAHAEVAMLAATEGVTPLQHLLGVLNSDAPESRKDAVATACLPFMHPRLKEGENGLCRLKTIKSI